MREIRIIFLFILFASSCSNKLTKTIIINNDKDLIPEGIAIAKNRIFISSIHKNKIIEFEIKQSSSKDFIKSDFYNFKSGIGLFVKKNVLYALTNDLYSEPNQSSVFVFDIHKKKLIEKFQLNDNHNHFFNDLTITKNNNIYITDSKQHKVYILDPSKGSFTEFLNDSTILYPNGITISDDNNILFIASALNGLRIFNIKTKKYTNISSIETKGIDGMKYHNNSIYAIRNTSKNNKEHGLIKIHLSLDNTNITKVDDILIGDKLMNIPTTLDIYKKHIYLIANSQMDNLNQQKNEIINKDSLKNTVVIKIKIKNGSLAQLRL